MRTLSALLMVLLLCSLQQVYCSGTVDTETFRECCEKLTHLKIPLRRIKSYGETSSNCPFKAVIFRTDKGKQWCVDPEASWVKKHLMELKPRS